MLQREARHLLLHVGLAGVRQTPRRATGPIWGGASLPAGANAGIKATYEEWVKKYGEDQAKYLMEEMNRWTDSYSHGTLIDLTS